MASQSDRQMVTHYDAFFARPTNELERLLVYLDLVPAEGAIQDACAGIHQDLRHSRSTLADLMYSDAPRDVIEEYLLLCRQAGPGFESVLAKELQECFPTAEQAADLAYWTAFTPKQPTTAAISEIDTTRDYEILYLRDLVNRRDSHLSQLAHAVRELVSQVEVLRSETAEKTRAEELLLAQVARQEQFTREYVAADSRMKGELAKMEGRLVELQSRLADVQSGLAYQFLSSYRRLVAQLLPPSSRRRQIYDQVRKAARMLLSGGPRRLYQRIRDGRRASGPPAGQVSSSGSGHRVAGGYAQAYADLVSVAANASRLNYVPLTSEDLGNSKHAVRAIAFYLPQYHPIPENDEWWGKGFTEWTNVSKAVPQFIGHYQPRLPGELGFYDLRLPEVQRRQIELAKKYGIYGFCIHYYWFNGKRLLEAPLEQFVNMPGNDFPFCLCWANENWTRRWDGQENEILLAQRHTEESDQDFIRDIAPYFRRANYIRIGGRPLLVVYRVPLMPDPAAAAETWRRYCREAGLGNPYLVAAQTFDFVQDPRKFGFDAAVEFPPHNIHMRTITPSLQMLNRDFAGSVHHYEDAVHFMMAAPKPDYRLFKTVFPDWDNEARKPGRANTFAFSSPHAYRDWLIAAGRLTMASQDSQERIVFINAWNEWGEAAYLEPDRRYGYAYLQATMDALKALDLEAGAPGGTAGFADGR
jgi:hypothetical protein